MVMVQSRSGLISNDPVPALARVGLMINCGICPLGSQGWGGDL
jgi:hypothetical protein